MLKRLAGYIRQREYDINLAAGFARAAATSALRVIDPAVPATWEFSAFSQNGEDGIIDYLTTHIKRQDRFFIEIGSADGKVNNSSWLAFGKKYSGIMIEGDPALSARSKRHLQTANLSVRYVNTFVDISNCVELCPAKTPDFFSIDIHGIDFYVAKTLLEAGFRPKVFCCEYNSSFGPTAAVTIKYKSDFARTKENNAWFYYGVSICAWKKLLKEHGYTFVCIEQRGVNAFFIDAKEFAGLPATFEGPEFRENVVQLVRSPGTWKEQSASIEHLPHVAV